MEKIKLIDLKFSEHHYRSDSEEAVEQMAASLKLEGQHEPIEITEDNIVIDGQVRVSAARLLGWTEIEVVNLSKQEIYLRAVKLFEGIRKSTVRW